MSEKGSKSYCYFELIYNGKVFIVTKNQIKLNQSKVIICNPSPSPPPFT